MPLGDLMFRYADGTDKIMSALAILTSIIFGASMPAFMVIFGELIDSMGSSTSADASGFDNLGGSSMIMVYVAAGMFVVATVNQITFQLFAENIQHKIRIVYFKSCLEKDATWFDSNNPNEMASRIGSECKAIERAVGEKIGQILQCISSVFFGFGFSFVWGWKLTLILMAFIPFIAMIGAWIAKAFMGGVSKNLKAYAQSAGYAEQALSAIKVVQTYGQEMMEIKIYNKYLVRAKESHKKQLFTTSIGVAAMYTILNFFYAFTFYWGGYLRYNKILAFGTFEYTGGRIVAIMFCVLIGCMRLGSIGPHLQAISEGRVAGRMTFDVLDAVPQVQ